MTTDEAAGYSDPPGWPLAAGDQPAGIALNWIFNNRGFMVQRVDRLLYADERGRHFWEPEDVVARMALRARKGGGLAASLAAHLDGSRPIEDPHKLLLKHIGWVVREFRKETNAQWSAEMPTGDPLSLEKMPPESPHDPDLPGDSRYVEFLHAVEKSVSSAFDLRFGGPPDAHRSWVVYLRARRPRLWEIFRDAAPPAVVAQVAQFSSDEATCVLLGIFPLRMSAKVISTYRVAEGTAKSATEEATRQKIARLRRRIASVWPKDSMPRRLGEEGDHGSS